MVNPAFLGFVLLRRSMPVWSEEREPIYENHFAKTHKTNLVHPRAVVDFPVCWSAIAVWGFFVSRWLAWKLPGSQRRAVQRLTRR